MAWTAPLTWTVGQLVSATNMNTHVRDNLLFLKSDPLIGSVTSTSVFTAAGSASAVLVISGLAIPADVGACYVEAWAPHFGHSGFGTTGFAQARIQEATEGVLSRVGNNLDVDQRYLGGHPAHYAPLYMRTPDYAWAGTTRTLNLIIESASGEVRIGAMSDSPMTMRVVRSY